jgi:hypothetical protein
MKVLTVTRPVRLKIQCLPVRYWYTNAKAALCGWWVIVLMYTAYVVAPDVSGRCARAAATSTQEQDPDDGWLCCAAMPLHTRC